MLKEAIQFLMEKARPELVECEGRQYSTNQLIPMLEPTPRVLSINTLTGLRDYLETNKDRLNYDDLLIHVKSAKEVLLYHRIAGPFEQRTCFLEVDHKQPEFPFGSYLDIEKFIVELQAKIVPDDTTATILQVVGNLTDGVVNTFADDGITQQVASKTGIGRVVNATIPNPVVLCPRRTFAEVDQPEGRFILRLKSGQGETKPTAALFEADGGMWQLDAIKRIQAWLRCCEGMPEEVAVIA